MFRLREHKGIAVAEMGKGGLCSGSWTNVVLSNFCQSEIVSRVAAVLEFNIRDST